MDTRIELLDLSVFTDNIKVSKLYKNKFNLLTKSYILEKIDTVNIAFSSNQIFKRVVSLATVYKIINILMEDIPLKPGYKYDFKKIYLNEYTKDVLKNIDYDIFNEFFNYSEEEKWELVNKVHEAIDFPINNTLKNFEILIKEDCIIPIY